MIERYRELVADGLIFGHVLPEFFPHLELETRCLLGVGASALECAPRNGRVGSQPFEQLLQVGAR